MREIALVTETDVVKTEADGRFSRDENILASGSGVVTLGTVLGELTSGANKGKFKPLDPSKTDGSQTAAAVILQYADATAADQVVVNLKRHAQVVLLGLRWPAGITAAQKDAALKQLSSLGIVARNGV